MQNLDTIYKLFYHTTNIPICIVRDGEAVLTLPNFEQPLFSKKFIDICIMDFHYQRQNSHQPLVLSLDPAYFLGIAQLSEGTFMLFGPAVSYQHQWDKIQLYLSASLYNDNRKSFANILMSAQPTSSLTYFNAFALALYLYDGRSDYIDEMLIAQPQRSINSTETDLPKYIVNANDDVVFHTRQSIEFSKVEAIEKGELEMLKGYLEVPISDRLGVMSQNDDRQNRYLFVANAAIFARAAIRGGLDYEMSCSIADKYCQQMDQSLNSSDLNLLNYLMPLDFCEKVNALKPRPNYSNDIQICCDIINKKTHEYISLQLLADTCKMSKNKLSEKFRAETGMSVADYIHAVKLKEAEILLRNTSYSISEIGSYLNFTNLNHFSELFIKKYNMSPRQFRNRWKSTGP